MQLGQAVTQPEVNISMMMICSLIIMRFHFKKAELQGGITHVICYGEFGNR